MLFIVAFWYKRKFPHSLKSVEGKTLCVSVLFGEQKEVEEDKSGTTFKTMGFDFTFFFFFGKERNAYLQRTLKRFSHPLARPEKSLLILQSNKKSPSFPEETIVKNVTMSSCGCQVCDLLSTSNNTPGLPPHL